MTFQEYHLETRRTLPDLDKLYHIRFYAWDKEESNDPKVVYTHQKSCLLPDNLLEQIHMVLGMISEVTELAAAQGKGDVVNIQEELVDILWYASNYAYLRNIDISGYQFPKFGYASCEDIAIAISDLSDYIKKYLAYKRDINIIDELEKFFKLLDTVGEFANVYKIDLYEGCQKNIDKLRVRFPHQFDLTLAQQENRNLEEERKKLE
jgi:hypothetical protein